MAPIMWEPALLVVINIACVRYLLIAAKTYVSAGPPPVDASVGNYRDRNRFQEPSLELSSQATEAGGPVR
jgi:hypothetical protein